jgi:hypothetical protein
MMNFKLQPSPISGTRESRVKTWGVSAKASDAKFFHLRLVYHSDLEAAHSHGRINWSSILGLALATAVSACFWAGVGLAIAHIWK